jgi:hypothetical protein
VGLRRGFRLRKVHLRSHLGLDILAPDHRLQDVQDPLRVQLLDLLHILKLLGIRTAPAIQTVRRRGQQLAGIVQHADRRRRQLRHTGRHQMHDAGELGPVQHAPRMQRHEHRRRRLLLLPEKPVLVGQRQVHPRTLHRGKRLDRARQFAFQPALKRQTLLKLRHAEAVRLHHLEARHRALGQSERRQTQAGVVHPVCRHQNGTAALGQLVRHVHGGQLGHDGAAILVRQIGIQHTPLGLAPEDESGDRHHDQQADAKRQTQSLRRRKPGESLGETRIDRQSGNFGHAAFQGGVAHPSATTGRNYSACPSKT